MSPCRLALSVSMADHIGNRMIIVGQTATEPDPSPVKLILKGFEISAALIDGKGLALEQVATRQGINSSYATRLLRLGFIGGTAGPLTEQRWTAAVSIGPAGLAPA